MRKNWAFSCLLALTSYHQTSEIAKSAPGISPSSCLVLSAQRGPGEQGSGASGSLTEFSLSGVGNKSVT